MSRLLEMALDNDAGKIVYFHPADREKYVNKGWRVCLELNGDWARKALTSDYSKISLELKKKRYEERPFPCVSDWKHFSKSGTSIFVFNPAEGCLVRGIIQLVKDYDIDPRTEEIVSYHDTNTDLKAQQDFVIEQTLEYVGAVNRILGFRKKINAGRRIRTSVSTKLQRP